MKKGVANIWWIIIGAVIALVVLIVILLIFTGKTGGVERGLLDCGSKGGKCVEENTCESQWNGTVSNVFDCTSPSEDCCFTLQKDGS